MFTDCLITADVSPFVRWFRSGGCAMLSPVNGWMGDLMLYFLLSVIMIVILTNLIFWHT